MMRDKKKERAMESILKTEGLKKYYGSGDALRSPRWRTGLYGLKTGGLWHKLHPPVFME